MNRLYLINPPDREKAGKEVAVSVEVHVRTGSSSDRVKQKASLGDGRGLFLFDSFGHIRRVNVMLGLFVPLLVTPLELLGAEQ